MRIYRGDMYIYTTYKNLVALSRYSYAGLLFFPTWISVDSVSFQLEIDERTLAVLPKNVLAVLFLLQFPPLLLLFLISKNVLFSILFGKP